jgi:hypothetical protein
MAVRDPDGVPLQQPELDGLLLRLVTPIGSVFDLSPHFSLSRASHKANPKRHAEHETRGCGFGARLS